MAYADFSNKIMELRYSHDLGDRKETWEEIIDRVITAIFSVKDFPNKEKVLAELRQYMLDRKFIPGGRFLAQAGREYHQTSNCFLLRAEDTREGWGNLMRSAAIMLMSGGGIGIDYSDIRGSGAILKRSGGTSSGPLPLMRSVNEIGRGVMSGGKRRSAIWAGLRWSHPDIFEFIKMKDWPEYIRKQKEKDFEAPAPMDMTNISVILDRVFFDAFDNPNHQLHEIAQRVYWLTVENMCKTGEPGFSVDYKNPRESLRNAPVHPDTHVLTDAGYFQIKDIAGERINVWTGKRFVPTTFVLTKENSPTIKINLNGDRHIIADSEHEFILDTGERIRADQLEIGDSLLIELPEYNKPASANISLSDAQLFYAFGYIYGDGTFSKKYPRADVTFCTDESKNCIKGFPDWSLTPTDKRGYSRIYSPNIELFRNRNKSNFPNDIYSQHKELQLSFLAGLFDADGNYLADQHRIRLASIHKEFLHDVRRLLESFGILSSVNRGGISTYGQKEGYLLAINGEYVSKFVELVPTLRIKPEGYTPYRKTKIKVLSVEPAENSDVYCCNVGVDEHSFMAEGIIISNCCEIVSQDNNDVCVLGSINLSKIKDKDELRRVTNLGILFLLLGTEYTDRPVPEVQVVQEKNRRLGLGLMGLHEWLIIRDKPYAPDDELGQWLAVWQDESDFAAADWSDLLNWKKPIATRAIAPNGTISIAGGQTTSGIEPIFAVAYKRRYHTPSGQKVQYVVDAVAERLIENGANPDHIEDAYSLSYNVEKRVAFQHFVQKYVDNAISSTINLPKFGTTGNDDWQAFGKMLYKYLPELRGITVYPDAARSGQPLEVVDYSDAINRKNHVFDVTEDTCKDGVCGL